MILSDREIQAALDRQSVAIDPVPPFSALSSTAIDLHLDAELRRWLSIGNGVDAAICPNSSKFSFTQLAKQYTEIVDLKQSGGFDLEPIFGDGPRKHFILGWTIEKIKLPHRARIAARVEGKSSMARLGVGIHVTAPTIHAGFGWDDSDPQKPGNPIQLEIWNVGMFKVRLEFGMPICQLILEEVHGTPDKGYRGQFADQGPVKG